MTKKQILMTLWRLATLAFALYGLALQLLPNTFYNLTYYTLLSNVLVAGFLIWILVLMFKGKWSVLNSSPFLRLKAGVTMSILLTFLVYAIMLAPIAAPEDFYHWKNYTLHYLVPIFFTIDWCLFDRPGAYHKLDPFLWTLLPLLYMVFALIKGYIFRIPIPDQAESPYPYFFLNIDQIGWTGFLGYAIAIFIGYLVLGYVLYFVKRSKRS